MGALLHTAVYIWKYLNSRGGTAFELDENVRRVDRLGRVGVLELQDLLVHVAGASGVDAHWLVRAAGAHEPACDVQVVDG